MELFKKLREEERMYGALREIMKDDLLREREEGRKEMQQEMQQEMQREIQRESQRMQQKMQNNFVERMINLGKPGDEISLVTDLGRQDIDKIARRMNRTVTWNEAGAAEGGTA